MTRLRPISWAALIAMMGVGLTLLPVVHGQSATLSGTISDPSGARIPNASVKLANPENGIIRTGATSAAGEFSFALLLPGTYTLEASSPGFKTTRQTGLFLTTGDTVADNLTLTIGRTEQVAVNETGPLLQTRDASISTELENKQIEELPLNLRNVLSYATLDSAVNVKTDEAFDIDRSLLGEDANDTEANLLAGEILVQRKLYAEAEPYLSKCGNLKPEYGPRWHALLGQVYAATDRISAAISEYQAGLSTDEDGSIHYQLARLYQKSGDKNAADDAFRASQRLRHQWDELAHIALEQRSTDISHQ